MIIETLWQYFASNGRDEIDAVEKYPNDRIPPDGQCQRLWLWSVDHDTWPTRIMLSFQVTIGYDYYLTEYLFRDVLWL